MNDATNAAAAALDATPPETETEEIETDSDETDVEDGDQSSQDDDIENNDHSTDTTETQATTKEPAPPVAALEPVETPAPVELSAPVALTGIFAGLAALFTDGVLLLTISKADNELLVTIQPPKAKDETAATVIPIQVAGTPEEIDANLFEALRTYVPTRRLAIETAADVARKTAEAANAVRAVAHKKPSTTTPTATSNSSGANYTSTCPLVVRVKPHEAVITIADAAGTSSTVPNGEKRRIPKGKTTITATLPGREPITKSVTLTSQYKVTTVKLEFPKCGALTVKSNPKDATITLTDTKSETVTTLEHAKRTSIPPGKYMLTLAKDGFETRTQAVTVGSDTQVLSFVLTAQPPSLFATA